MADLFTNDSLKINLNITRLDFRTAKDCVLCVTTPCIIVTPNDISEETIVP
jgi:hypothetical protein